MKKRASVLFMNLDIENQRIGVLTRLLTEYSTVFDFNFINSKSMAENASFLMNEMQKQRIELANKMAAIDEENKKQRDFFLNAQKKFDDSKSELEDRVNKLEQIVMDQQAKLERYTKVKVRKIGLKCEQNFLITGSTITVRASVRPKMAFNDGVEWQILQDVDGTVRVESMDQKELVLMCLRDCRSVVVVASALDGSGASARMEIFGKKLEATIEINVQQDQMIRGRIKIEEGRPTLDTSRSKYVINTSSDASLGESAYRDGFPLDSSVKEVSFAKPRGHYFVHAFVADSVGRTQELVSQVLRTNGAEYSFGYTGSLSQSSLSRAATSSRRGARRVEASTPIFMAVMAVILLERSGWHRERLSTWQSANQPVQRPAVTTAVDQGGSIQIHPIPSLRTEAEAPPTLASSQANWQLFQATIRPTF